MDMPTKQEFLNFCYANDFDMKKAREYFGMDWHLYGEFKELHNLPKRINALSLLTDEQFIELYMDTENDFEMASILGVTQTSVSASRRNRNLDIERVKVGKRKYEKKVKS